MSNKENSHEKLKLDRPARVKEGDRSMLNDTEQLKRIRGKLNLILENLGKEEGITFSIGNMRFEPNGSECGFKVTMYSGTEEKPKHTRDLEKHSPITLWTTSRNYKKGPGTFKGSSGTVTVETEDLTTEILAEDIGKTFSANGEELILVGYLPKGRTFNWVGSRGKNLYKFTDAALFPAALEWRK